MIEVWQKGDWGSRQSGASHLGPYGGFSDNMLPETDEH